MAIIGNLFGTKLQLLSVTVAHTKNVYTMLLMLMILKQLFSVTLSLRWLVKIRYTFWVRCEFYHAGSQILIFLYQMRRILSSNYRREPIHISAVFCSRTNHSACTSISKYLQTIFFTLFSSFKRQVQYISSVSSFLSMILCNECSDISCV